MRVTWIRVSNYRRVPDFDIPVGRHLVLIGPNDSGKSAILRGLHLLLGASARQLYGAFHVRDFTIREQPIVIEAELQDFSEAERGGFPDEISLTGTERLVIRLNVSIDAANPELPVVTRWFPESGHNKAPSPEQLELLAWAFVPASRELSRELGTTGRQGVLRSLLENLALVEATDFDAIFSDIRNQLNSAPAFAAFRRQLAAALNETLPNPVSDADLRLITAFDVQDDPVAQLTVGVAEGAHAVPLSSQSDGLRALATLAVFNIAHVGLNMIAIDEPETYLHPSSQENVARLMSQSNAQRVVATHSSHIARMFDPRDVVSLGRNRMPRRLPSGSPADEATFAFRWWRELVGPLTAEAIIAVEGPSDRIVVEACAEALGLSVHKSSIVVLDLQGAENFARASGFFGASGFGIPFFGLVDEDLAPKWATVLGTTVAQLGESDVFVSRKELEEMYVSALGTGRVLQLFLQSGLFTRPRLIARFGYTRLGELTHSDVYTVARGSKVAAAVALSKGLHAYDAVRLEPIFKLFERIVAH